MRGEVLGNLGADYGSILWQQPGAGNMRLAAASIHRNI